MTWDIGDPVTIDSQTAEPSGSGQCRALYDAIYQYSSDDAHPLPDPLNPPEGWPPEEGIQGWLDVCVAQRSYFARIANGIANGLVPYMKAVVTVPVTVTIAPTDAGLQRLPADIIEDEPTKGPVDPKFINGQGFLE